MKIVSLTKIKNEADIIESFVKYHANILDELYFVENGSLDGTMEILKALKKEGYPVFLFDERGAKFDRLKFAAQYLYSVNNISKADWIIPLDTDEFLCAAENVNPRNVIEKFDTDKLISLSWRVYAHKDVENTGTFLPEKFRYYWSEVTQKKNKVIISSRCLRENDFLLLEGYHGVKADKEIKTEETSDIYYAHYPIRSIEQVRKQILINGLNLMQDDSLYGMSAHWRKMYEDIKADSIDLYNMSKYYVEKYNTDFSLCEGKIFTSFCRNLDLQFADMQDMDVERNLINYVEELIINKRISEIKNQSYHKANYVPQVRKKVVLFGVGINCMEKERYIDKNTYEIIAYADSDKKKQYCIYNDRLIVPPDKLQAFQWDLIIIMSDNYLEDIKKQLKQKYSLDRIISITDLIIGEFKNNMNDYKEA